MPDVKISALPAATSLTGSEVIPVVQGGVTKRATPDQMPLGAAQQIAVNALVTASVNALVNGAPAALDTLKEIADAFGDNPNFLQNLLTDTSLAAALQAGTGQTATQLAATYSTLAQLAASPDLLAVGTITRSATGAATGFAVAWPDGATGTFTGTESTNPAAAGAIDSYTVTKTKGGTTVTFTQPAVTRDANGAVTNRPAMTAA